MPMHATTVRFGADLWEMLEGEANREGVSAAQFVRDATLLRLGALAGVRGDSPTNDAVSALAELVRRREELPLPLPLRPVEDPARVRAARATGLFDREAEPAFTRLAELARRMVGVPTSAINLVDDRCQLFVAGAGLPEGAGDGSRELDLEMSFCQHVVDAGVTLAIPDVRLDHRMRETPVIDAFGAIAYLGVPLIDRARHVIGTLCVIDRQPRLWTVDEIGLLEDLAPSVMTEIEIRSPALLL
jgi:GAF domain-containing protein